MADISQLILQMQWTKSDNITYGVKITECSQAPDFKLAQCSNFEPPSVSGVNKTLIHFTY